MASALPFHVVQCLFCFYFCFVTWETLGNGLDCSQLQSPETGWTLSSSQHSTALWCTSTALWCTSTAVAWSSAELKDINRGEKLKVHIWHATSFPWTVCHVVQFWREHRLRGTKDSAVWIQPRRHIIYLFFLYVISRVKLLVKESSPPLLLRAKCTKD